MQKNEIKLLLAAKANDFIGISKILMKTDKAKAKRKSKCYIDIDARNVDGITALHFAARHGNIEMMEEILSRGALIDAIDNIGWRPLSYACANQKVNAVEKLIDWGSKINMPNDDNSPIHIAAAFGHVNIVKILLAKGADIKTKNKRHQTPMDIACQNSHYEVVNVLISACNKRIEEAPKINFQETSSKPGSQSRIPSVPLVMAKSTSNITTNVSFDQSSCWSDPSAALHQMKRYQTGSQERISSNKDYKMQTFKSNTAKKSESLNAIFVQVEDDFEYKNDARDIFKMSSRSSKSSKSDTKLKVVKNEPSDSQKLSPPPLVKIKSPMFPLSNNLRKDTLTLHKGISLPLYSNSGVASSRNNGRRDDVEEVFQYRKDHCRNQNTRNKVLRSSLPVEPNNSYTSSSLSMCMSPEILDSGNNKERVMPISFRNYDFEDQLPAEKIGKENVHGIVQKMSSQIQNQISCNQWIDSIGLTIIWDTLVSEGFDSFLSLSLATDEDLLILCNDQRDKMHLLQTGLRNLNIPPVDQLIFSSDIENILTQLGLEEYSLNFISNGYINICHLPNISERFLNHLEIIKIGHRRLLMSCLESQVQRRLNLNKGSQEISQCMSAKPFQFDHSNLPMISVHSSSATDISGVTNSTDNSCEYMIKPIKRLPPPIPPRSCSISNENLSITESITINENQNTEKGDPCIFKEMETDLANLDEIVAMLDDLGKELDDELNTR